MGAQIEARADGNRKGPDLKRPAYQSDLKPVPIPEPRVPLFRPPSPSSTWQEVPSSSTPDLATSVSANSASDAIAQGSQAEISDSLSIPVEEGWGEGTALFQTPASQTCSLTTIAQDAADAETVCEDQTADPSVAIAPFEESWRDETEPEVAEQIPPIEPECDQLGELPRTPFEETHVEELESDESFGEEPRRTAISHRRSTPENSRRPTS